MKQDTKRIVAVSFDDCLSFTIHLAVQPDVAEGSLYLRLGALLTRAIQNGALASDGISWAWADESPSERHARDKRIQQLLGIPRSAPRVPRAARRSRASGTRRPSRARREASLPVPNPE